MWLRFCILLLVMAMTLLQCQAEKDSNVPAVNAPIIIQAKSKVSRANDFKKKLLEELSTKKPIKLFGLPAELQKMFTNEFMPSRALEKTSREPTSTTAEPTLRSFPWTNRESTVEFSSTTESSTEQPIADASTEMATERSSLWTALFTLLESQEPTTKTEESSSTMGTVNPPSSTTLEVPMGSFMRFLQTIGMVNTESSSRMNNDALNEASTDVMTSPSFHEVSAEPESTAEVEHHARFARQVNFTEADAAFGQDHDIEDDVEFVDEEEDGEENEPEVEEEQDIKAKEKMKNIPEQKNAQHKPSQPSSFPLPLPIDVSRLVNMKDDKIVSFQSETTPMANQGMNKDAAMFAKVPLYFQGAGSQLSREQPMFFTPVIPNLPFRTNNPLDLYNLLAMVLKNQIVTNTTLPVPNLLLPNVPIVNYSKPNPIKETEHATSAPVPVNETEKQVNPLNTFYSKSYKPDKISPDLKSTGKDDSKELFPAESSPEKVSAKKPEDTDYEYEYVYYYYDEDDPNNKTMVVKPAANIKPKVDLKKPSATEKSLNLPIKDDLPPLITPLPHNTVSAEGRAVPAANLGKSSLLENPIPPKTKPKLESEFDAFPTSAPIPVKPSTFPPQLLSTPLLTPKIPSHPFIPGPESPVLFLGIQKESGLSDHHRFAHTNSDLPTKDPANLVSLYAFSKALDSTSGDGLNSFSSRPQGTPPSFQAIPSESEQDLNKKSFNLQEALFSHAVFDPLANVTEELEETSVTTQKIRDTGIRSRPVLPSFRGDKDFGGKPSISKTTSTTTTTTEEPATTAAAPKGPSKPVRGRRPTSHSRTTTTTTAASSTGKPTRATRPSRKNSRTRNKETTTPAPSDDENPVTEKPSRGGSRTSNRKSKSRTTTTTTAASTSKSSSDRKSNRRNKQSNRNSRTKSRTTTTTTASSADENPTTTEGHNRVAPKSPKRLSNLFPRRRGPTTTTTGSPEAEPVEEKPEDSENEASVKTTTVKSTTSKATTTATTTTSTTIAPPTDSEGPKQEEEVEIVTEEETPAETTRPPLIRFRPLRPLLRTTTTTAPESEAS